MAVNHKGRMMELQRQWKDRETSPERTKVWTEPKPKVRAERKVPVVYYLSRSGQLEHPHFMEVTLSSADGLYLRDVVDRLNNLRGKGMASMYSWSSKRSYKNGFVWHDLSENDFIYPVHGHEYVLKGSELLQAGVVSPSSRDGSSATSAVSSSGSEKSVEDRAKPIQDADGGSGRRKKTTPCQSFDFNEYKVYKTDSKTDSSAMAADASTQTDDRRQCRRALIRDGRSRGGVPKPEEEISPTTELNRDEISPPPSSSSPETLETLIKADVRATAGGRPAHGTEQAAAHPGGRLRASAVLMHLISCGSLSVKDHGFSLVSQYRARLPRGREGEALDRAAAEARGLADRASFPTVNLEDKEYFSGSLIETKKKAASESAGELAALKRSSSFNADRCSKTGLAEESDGVRAKCIPRRPAKPSITRRDGGNKGSVSSRSSDGVREAGDRP